MFHQPPIILIPEIQPKTQRKIHNKMSSIAYFYRSRVYACFLVPHILIFVVFEEDSYVNKIIVLAVCISIKKKLISNFFLEYCLPYILRFSLILE